MSLPLSERLKLATPQWRQALHQSACDLRVCCPGIVQDFDTDKQTVSVKLAIREKVILTDPKTLAPDAQHLDIPLLTDVPIVVLRAGGFSITPPIQEGDECLVVFADACMDGWWQSGGVQNQLIKRRHSLSDGIAIFGLWSQPNVLTDYSADTLQIRSDDGELYIELASGHIVNIVAPGGVNITGDVNVTGTVVASGEGTFNGGHTVSAHKHPGVQTGSGDTGTPTG